MKLGNEIKKRESGPFGNNEAQVVIEFFTREDPAEHIRQKAEDFIASRKWQSSEILYADQKEEKESGDNTQWHSAVFVLGVDHITKSGTEWVSDLESLFQFALPLADLNGPDSTVSLYFRSVPHYQETISFFECPATTAQMEQMIRRTIENPPRYQTRMQTSLKSFAGWSVSLIACVGIILLIDSLQLNPLWNLILVFVIGIPVFFAEGGCVRK